MSKRIEMKCERIKELLSDYINGDLSEGMRALVDNHLESCPSCRLELKKLEKMCVLLRSFQPVEPPLGFAQKVLASYYSRRKKASLLRSFFLGGLQPKRALAYAGLSLLLVISIALLSLLPWWTRAKQSFLSPRITLKRAPSIISARGIGKILILPQNPYPNPQGILRVEIMIYPPYIKENVWLSIRLSPGLTLMNGNPFLPSEREIYIGKIDNPVAFWTDVKVISEGVQWIKVACVSDNIKWAEGFLFLPPSGPPLHYLSISQSDIDAIQLLAMLVEKCKRPVALPFPISAKLNFSYQGEGEEAIHHFASLLGLTAIKYNSGYILELP
ncbi:MAG: anti-sigma factor family protein [bacterium]